jgi:hypothetical protein
LFLLIVSVSAPATTTGVGEMSREQVIAFDQALTRAGITGESKVSAAPKLKKHSDAPRRFKSAFIIFSAEKHKAIKADLAKEGRTEKVCLERTLPAMTGHNEHSCSTTFP